MINLLLFAVVQESERARSIVGVGTRVHDHHEPHRDHALVSHPVRITSQPADQRYFTWLHTPTYTADYNNKARKICTSLLKFLSKSTSPNVIVKLH